MADIQLSDVDPADTSPFKNEAEAKDSLAVDADEINRLQDRLYAEGKRSLLVVLQGTDSSGKDGTIRGVFNETGPIGVTVTAFGVPTRNELAHDFLWRAHMACPRRGTIGIFNRSHYEDVLVPVVRGEVTAETTDARYRQINDFEQMLSENGTTILKFMLHISRDEQGKRLHDRLTQPNKMWKFRQEDLDDRAKWAAFQAAYARLLLRTSTPWAPWRVVPSDKKWARNAIVARAVRDTLTGLGPQFPVVSLDPSQFQID